MVVGGVYTLWSMRKTIGEGLSKAFKASESSQAQLRTEMDIPLNKVTMVCGVLVIMIFLFYWYATEMDYGSWRCFVPCSCLVLLRAVAGYIAGVVGSSNSPVSGMTIATLLFTIGLVWVVGGLLLGLGTGEMMVATMFIASIVATSAAIAGDVMQDLKTGHMVGATPWRQQTAEIVGVVVGALVIGPVLSLLHKAFRITRTACEANPLSTDPNCENALEAPQAELIGAIVKGAFGGEINLPMVLLVL